MSALPDPPVLTMYHLLRLSAETFPTNVAQMYRSSAVQEFQKTTFSELFASVQAVALGLMAVGMRKGDCVGLIVDVGHRWLWLSLGITTVGGVDIPRGTDATAGDLAYIFAHAECPIVVLQNTGVYEVLQPHLGKLPALKTIVFCERSGPARIPPHIKAYTLAEIIEQGRATGDGERKFREAASAVRAEDLLTVIYTSGTTGAPKGVMHSHGSVAWEVVHAIRGFKIPPGGATMGFLPPWHIAERLIELVALRTATAIVFTSVQTLAKDIRIANPTFLLAVPRFWESFYNRVLENVAKSPPLSRILFRMARRVAVAFSVQKDILLGRKYRLQPNFIIVATAEKIAALIALLLLLVPSLAARQILAPVRRALGNRIGFGISGTGALPEHIDRFFYAIGVPIVETYGMTETVGVTCRRSLPHLVVGTVGRPIEGTEIKLVDPDTDRTIQSPYEKGVAWHRGPHIMQGYYKDPERTAAVLRDGWLNSGDLLMYTVQGDLKFSGRVKDTIVLLGGENVEPEPIEDSLNQSPFIETAVVVGQDRKNLGVLLIPNVDAVRAHFARVGQAIALERDAWNADPAVRNLLHAEIKRLNSEKLGFKRFERVAQFHILARDFHVGDEITHTLKIKRNVVLHKYRTEIDGMYS